MFRQANAKVHWPSRYHPLSSTHHWSLETSPFFSTPPKSNVELHAIPEVCPTLVFGRVTSRRKACLKFFIFSMRLDTVCPHHLPGHSAKMNHNWANQHFHALWATQTRSRCPTWERWCNPSYPDPQLKISQLSKNNSFWDILGWFPTTTVRTLLGRLCQQSMDWFNLIDFFRKNR